MNSIDYSVIVSKTLKAIDFNNGEKINFNLQNIALIGFSEDKKKYALVDDLGRYLVLNKTNCDWFKEHFKKSADVEPLDYIFFFSILKSFIGQTLIIKVRETTVEKDFLNYKKGQVLKGFVIVDGQRSL